MNGSASSGDVDEAQMRRVHTVLCDAMVEADVTTLDQILADGFTLQHMTGYVQSKAEWLEEIASGSMRYSSIENRGISVAFDSGSRVLDVQTVTVATIWGSAGTWRLRLRSRFRGEDGQVLIDRTVASVW